MPRGIKENGASKEGYRTKKKKVRPTRSQKSWRPFVFQQLLDRGVEKVSRMKEGNRWEIPKREKGDATTERSITFEQYLWSEGGK